MRSPTASSTSSVWECRRDEEHRFRAPFQFLRGLWLRGRFAWGHIDRARRDSLEGRVVLRYEFQVL